MNDFISIYCAGMLGMILMIVSMGLLAVIGPSIKEKVFPESIFLSLYSFTVLFLSHFSNRFSMYSYGKTKRGPCGV